MSNNMLSLCQDTAANVWRVEPNGQYYNRVVMLLLGTAATESHFRYRRQLSRDGGEISWNSNVGAWGLWQTEHASVYDNLKYLQRNPDVADRVARFVWQNSAASGQLFDFMATAFDTSDTALRAAVRLCYNDDRWAATMARIHYLRVPQVIPATLDAQAEYWKRYYNTAAGAGTPAKYIQDWHRLVVPLYGTGGYDATV